MTTQNRHRLFIIIAMFCCHVSIQQTCAQTNATTAVAGKATTHRVKSSEQIETLIGSGQLSAGDTIIWADGDYSDVTLKLDLINGEPSKPITLKAASPGGVKLQGESRLHIGVQWWVIEGFHFAGQQGQFNSYNTVEFRGRGNISAQHVRMTNCAFTDLVPEDSSSKWVQLFGHNNTIDHCYFSGKNSRGALMTVELGYLTGNQTAGHRIAWNHFANFSPLGGTDNETIRIGSSEDQHKSATCLVERNLFTRCDGENEIITNKSSFNTFRSNTFRQCNGALVLRHGHHARVEGNYFFGDGTKDSGGIRISDSHHVVVNNYLQDLTGTTWNAAFSILGGKKTSGQPSSGYQAVDEIVVAHNTIVNCKRSIFLNKEKGSRAPTGVMANNLIVSKSAPLIQADLKTDQLKWTGNLLFGTIGAQVEAINSDPGLKAIDGVFRPDPTGPAAGAAKLIEAEITHDIDGQTRPKTGSTIGADEIAIEQKVTLKPLKASDVGVSFSVNSAIVTEKTPTPKSMTPVPNKGPTAVAARESSLPNIILVMSDDQGWGDVGFNGNERIKTPHLDAMAASGIRFNRFYAAAPLCSPTRGSCLTGRYPFRFGILAAHTGGMRVGETTIPELLKKRGFATGMFGKWHVGWVKSNEVGTRGFYSPPSHHGFDEYFATTSAVPTWNPTVTPDDWDSWGGKPGEAWKGGFPYVHNGAEAKENLSGDDSRVIMDRVIPFIETNRSKPFFAAVWFHAPHEPVVAGEEFKKMYPEAGKTRKNYYGCITAMDQQIGRLRSKLRELGIEKDTAVFFCSDNGPSDGLAKKGVASAGSFKGHKHTMYEGGLLVPACAEWPGTIPAGGTTDVRCSTVDFLPTIASIVGDSFAKKASRPIDGIDLMPVIRGDVKDRSRDLFFGYRRLHKSIDGKAIISGNWKLLKEAKKDGRVRLFDIAKDPYEKHDLAAEMPEQAKRLSQQLEELEASCQRSRDGADYRY